jgi:ribonuclease III
MDEATPKSLEPISSKLGYTFKEPSLLEEAFRHASYANEMADSEFPDNERLEFLGDAVLDLVISHVLMDIFPDAKEGDLSKYRASVVDEKGLCQVARELGLGELILLGKGEALSGGRHKPSILANTLEALVGALYLDAGFSRTKEIVYERFRPHLAEIVQGINNRDYKSLLQEHTQEWDRTRPQYVLVEESGPAHDRTFKVALQLKGEIIALGVGKSKKQAEQIAAKEGLFCLKGENGNH